MDSESSNFFRNDLPKCLKLFPCDVVPKGSTSMTIAAGHRFWRYRQIGRTGLCWGINNTTHRLCWGRPVRQFCCPTSSHNPKKWLFVKPIRVVSAFHLFVHDVLLGLTFLFACYFCAALALAEICPAVYLSSALGLELAKKRPRNMGLNLHACSSATYFLVQLTQDPYSTTISIDIFTYSSSPLLYTHVDSI